MTISQLIFALFFCMGAQAATEPQYDKPEKLVEWKKSIKGAEARDIKYSCHDYGNFWVYEQNDPYNKGPVEIVVLRPKRGRLPPAPDCPRNRP